jgi:NADPH2:quinone reductase
VVACASTEEKRRLASEAGADHTLPYDESAIAMKEALRQATGGGADVVVDPVGGVLGESALRALGTGGRHVVLGFASGDIPALPANQVLLNNRTVVGVDWGAWALSHPTDNVALLRNVLELLDDRQITPTQPTQYPLRDANRCLTDLRGRRAAGPLVLVP